MGDHDTTSIEDGFVVCRCESTGEAMARWRMHVSKIENLERVAEARAELERAKGEQE